MFLSLMLIGRNSEIIGDPPELTKEKKLNLGGRLATF